MKQRLREIDIEKLEEIRISFDFKKKDIAEILNVSTQQISNYYRHGKIGADKYYLIINALRLQIESEAIKKRKQLDEALGIIY